jgi:hypothetical protein
MALHTVILMGSSQRGDGWMLADADKLAWAVADANGAFHFLAHRHLFQYNGSSTEGCILGEPTADRLIVPHPPAVSMHQSPAALKEAFLDRVLEASTNMALNDRLFIAFSSHGRQVDGAVLIGDPIDTSNQAALTKSDLLHALRNKPKSARTFLWASASFFGILGEGVLRMGDSNVVPTSGRVPVAPHVPFRAVQRGNAYARHPRATNRSDVL